MTGFLIGEKKQFNKLKPRVWHENNSVCHTWFERDRAMVRLTDTRGKEIICLFDNEVSEFIEDGFKKENQSWHEALTDYATDQALTTK